MCAQIFAKQLVCVCVFNKEMQLPKTKHNLISRFKVLIIIMAVFNDANFTPKIIKTIHSRLCEPKRISVHRTKAEFLCENHFTIH